jgi:DNA-binding NarL/FixJ family response regulator
MTHTVLVVDDTKFMRKMLTDMLKQFGYKVVGEADNGRQAVQKFNELRPEIVMMDITMPEMDGIEAMREIRRIEPSAVVLICSAMSQQDLISDALKAGANGYVMKPFKPDKVHEVIRKNVAPHIQAFKPPVKQLAEPPAAAQQEEMLPEVSDGGGTPLEAGPSPGEEDITEMSLPELEELELQETGEEKKQAEAAELAGIEMEESGQAEPEPEAEVSLAEDAAGETAAEEEPGAPEESAGSLERAAMLESPDPCDAAGNAGTDESAGKEWTLDELNELTLVMDLPCKVIPIIRGGTNVKKFVSSYMCNWSEELNGNMLNYLVICTESENLVSLEVVDDKQEMHKIELSLEGFKQLISWMEDKLSAGSNVRDLPRKSEM